jgi:hypothetical protein
MALHTPLSDIVLFELPTRTSAHRLVGHLALTRLSWLEEGDDACVVGAFLQLEDADLAVLLRSVQEWVEQAQLAAIRFEVDGRTYVLAARQRALAFAA